MRALTVSILMSVALWAQTPAPPQDPASISGRVTSREGQAVRKATVTARGIPSGPPPANGQYPQMSTVAASTDADGRYVLKELAPGNYSVSVEHPNFLRTNYAAKASPLNLSLVTLKAGQNASDIDIVMLPQSIISGRITDQDGEPIIRAQVVALKRMFGMAAAPQYVPNGRATTDENGDYRITSLAAGKYVVDAAPAMAMRTQNVRRPAADLNKPEESEVTTFYPGSARIAQATPIDLMAGEEKAGTNFRLLKIQIHHVRGKVTGDIPLGSAGQGRVAAMSKDLGLSYGMENSTAVDKDGSFDIGNVTPGAYNIALMSTRGQVRMLANTQVNVGDEDLNNVVLDAAAPVTLTGVIREEGEPKQQHANPNGAGAQGQDQTRRATYRISLTAIDRPIFVRPTTTAANGMFTLDNVDPGTYQMMINPMGPGGGYVKSIKLAGREMLDSGLLIAPGAAGPVEVTIAFDGGEIDGTVTMRDGVSSPQGPIMLVPEVTPGTRSDLYKMSVSSPGGQFRMLNVPPGKYRVYSIAQAEPGSQYDPDFLQLHAGESQRVTVEAGGTVQVTLTR